MYKSIFTIIYLFIISNILAQQTWKAPASADNLKNPLLNHTTSFEEGQKIFKSLCVSCHGDDGTGNPVMVKSLNPPPANLISESVQNQPDGIIFWKISEGRGMMASYKNMLSEHDRWAVVNYIRHLAKQHTQSSPTIKSANLETLQAFPFSQLINAKTTTIRQNKGFGFGIQHRFGVTKFDDGFLKNFMGLDLSANVRFSFEIPVNQRLMFEIGRTRFGKFYDFGLKYLLKQQTINNQMPVSIAFYENIAVMTDQAPATSSSATFAGGKPFEFRFLHRLYYDTQMIISRKFNHNFSAQVAIQMVWRNLTPYSTKPKQESYVMALPIGMRYKLGFKSALDFEVMPNTQAHTIPISLAYEVASSGNHVFQITITNSNRILSQNLLFLPTLRYPKDGFILGFNLVRYF